MAQGNGKPISDEVGWLEPPFFRLRTITRRGWYARLSAFLGVILYFVAARLLLPVEKDDLTWGDVLIRATGAGLFMAFIVDLFWLVRYVWIDKRGISYCAMPVLSLSMQGLNRFAVESVTLLRGDDPSNVWKRPVMVVRLKRDAEMVFALNERPDIVENRLRETGYTVNAPSTSPR